MYHKKTIKELLATPEGGYFVVCGRIAGFFYSGSMVLSCL